MLQSNEDKERKALQDYSMTEARKALHRDTTKQMRESRTNQPSFLLPVDGRRRRE